MKTISWAAILLFQLSVDSLRTLSQAPKAVHNQVMEKFLNLNLYGFVYRDGRQFSLLGEISSDGGDYTDVRMSKSCLTTTQRRHTTPTWTSSYAKLVDIAQT